MFKYLALSFAVIQIVVAQRRQEYQSATTPVPILLQINTHNQDGSYTYGYEGADGSYKIENKDANGGVKGKYGYYDDAGQLREIEYGANRDGFNPSGTGINVPPHVPANRNYNTATGVDYDDDGQYRPDQYEKPYEYKPDTSFAQNSIQRPQQRFSARNFQQQQQVQNANYYQPEEYVQPTPRRQPSYRAAYTNPIQPNFSGHPATNIDLNSGSYSINY